MRAREQLHLEQQFERRIIRDLLAAYHRGDADRFRDVMLADVFPWPEAFKEFAKLTNVSVEMQAAFQSAWCDSKGRALESATVLERLSG